MGRAGSGGSGQGFFGGARRCTERAANLYAERGGEGQNKELRRMKAKVSRLEISSASYKRKWRSTCEFAESEEAGRRADMRLQDPRGPGGEPGQTSKRASTGTSHDPGPKTVGADSPKTAGGGESGDDRPGNGTEGAQGVSNRTGLRFTGDSTHRTEGKIHQVRGGFNVNSDGSGSEWTPQCQDRYSEQLRRIEEAQRTRGMSAKPAAVLHTFLDERRANQQWQADRRREREAESRGDGHNEADKAEGPQRVHADFTLTRDLQQARVHDKQTRDRETREHDRGKSGRPANDESLGGFSEAAALLLRVSCYRLNSSFSQDNVTNKTRSPAHPVPELGTPGHHPGS